MNDNAKKTYGPYLGDLVLNIGCAKNHETDFDGHKFINLDKNANVNPDVVHDAIDIPWPFQCNTFSAVVASHFFEHIHKHDFINVVAEIHRILRPDGHLLSFTPYGTSFDSWENPFHVQNFTETTFYYVMDWLYENKDTAGNGADEGAPVRSWEMVQTILVPQKEFENDPDIEFKRKHWNNVIREMHVVLKAKK